MSENIPNYPDIVRLPLPAVDEDTKQKLLNGTWSASHKFAFPTRSVFYFTLVSKVDA